MKKIALFTFYILLSISTVFSQDIDEKSQAILNKLSTKMKDVKSFYLEFSANIKNNATGMNETSTGKGWVKDKKYYASYGDNTILSNGLKTWTIVKEEKTVYESDASDDNEESMNPKRLLTIWENGFKNRYDREEVLNGESVHILYLYPKEANKADYHTIILYISKSSNEVKKAILKNRDGAIMTYSITKFSPDETIEDVKFVFDARKYPGYEVIRD